MNGVKSNANVSWNFFLFFFFLSFMHESYLSFLHKLNWIAYKWHPKVIDSISDLSKLETWVPRVGIWQRESFHPMPNTHLVLEREFFIKAFRSILIFYFVFLILSIFGFSSTLFIISYTINYSFRHFHFYIDFLNLRILVLMKFIQSQ